MSLPNENEYYQRQLILEGFGSAKQLLLKKSHIVVVGAGGLGCPALQYLVGAGIGTITIVDGDTIQLNNLHRQVIFSIDDIGKHKAEIAAVRLRKLNPFIQINAIKENITAENIKAMLYNVEVVIDASDNFKTRFLLGDVTAKLNIPLVYAAIYAFEGQLTVFNYKNGSALRDLFPVEPASNAIPNCATNGAIGFVPGIIGTMQAAEAIKIITHSGDVCSGKLQQFNLLNFDKNEFVITKRQGLSEQSTDSNTSLTLTKNEMNIQEITSTELNLQLNNNSENIYLLDVREPFEWNQFNIGGTLMPMLELNKRMNEIPTDKDIVVVCKSGYRSYKAAEALVKHYEFKSVSSLKGGLVAWLNEVEIGE